MLRSLLRSALPGILLLATSPAFSQVLVPGDMAIIGINANNGACSGVTAEDEISFICFKTINTGTRLWLTDKGYEYQNAGFWGTVNEGIVQLQRTGTNLPAGTVITIRINGGGTCTPVTTGWTATSPVANMNLNSGGDQIFIFQANAGAAFTGAANNGVFSNCTLLYGFSTAGAPNDWVSFQNSTQRSGLPPGMICFSMSPAASSDFTKYVPFEYNTPPLITRTQRQWIIDIDDQIRWNSYASCTAYNTTNAAGPSNTWSPNWVSWPTVFPITAGGFVNGRWTGAKTTDWFDCRNWDDAEVPIATSNVLINPLYAPINNCVIGLTVSPPTAVAATVTVQTAGVARTLTIQNDGALQVGGNVTVSNTGAVSGFNGITIGNGATDGNLTAAGITLSGNGVFKGGFRSEQVGNSVAIAGNITINTGGYLDLSGGLAGGTVSLTGNYTNNDAATAFDEVGSTLIFNGAGPQSVNTSGFQEEFGYFTLNKSSNDVTLNAPALVKATMTMTSGRLMTSDPAGLLSMSNTGAIFGANDAAPSFVHGPMVKIGITSFTFPIGKATRLHPASISNLTAGPTDAFIAEYFDSDPQLDIGTPIETPPLDHISSCEYWNLEPYSGTPVGRVTLSWKQPMSCGVTNLADLRVAHWDGSMWADRGNGGAAGSFLIGTIPQAATQETDFGPGGFWTLASISEDNPLPIELLLFDARREGSEVRLDWSTATERDNDYFTVERSANGLDFADVLRVDGAGFSNTTLTYTDIDRWPLPGTSFYRLRQTDFDGASTVSNMVAVRMPGQSTNGLVLLTDDDRVIAVHDFSAGSTMDVVDMTGRIVWRGRVETEGRSYVPFDAIGSGAYLLRISDDLRSESAPFVR